MAVFGSPFSGLANKSKLTDAELIRAILKILNFKINNLSNGKTT
jgi:hypothetical protein